jgi:hypothetical protein
MTDQPGAPNNNNNNNKTKCPHGGANNNNNNNLVNTFKLVTQVYVDMFMFEHPAATVDECKAGVLSKLGTETGNEIIHDLLSDTSLIESAVMIWIMVKHGFHLG